jgi:hypothetical protein
MQQYSHRLSAASPFSCCCWSYCWSSAEAVPPWARAGTRGRASRRSALRHAAAVSGTPRLLGDDIPNPPPPCRGKNQIESASPRAGIGNELGREGEGSPSESVRTWGFLRGSSAPKPDFVRALRLRSGRASDDGWHHSRSAVRKGWFRGGCLQIL